MINKTEILEKAKAWFTHSVVKNHIRNTKKLSDPKEFNINPFLAVYLANFLTGNASAESIAKVLVYPRVLGTSITTSFGTQIQAFTHSVLDTFGSTTAGIDIEFVDQLDGQKKYCQLKLGPDTINKDDVETIAGHFQGIRNLARTNKLRLSIDDLIVGVIYGRSADLNSHYKRITVQYHHPVFVGKDFWHRLTGDENFYIDLIEAIASVAGTEDFSAQLQDVISMLAKSDAIQKIK